MINNFLTISFESDFLVPKYACPSTASSTALFLSNEYAWNKDLLPWFILHNVTDGKNTFCRLALEKKSKISIIFRKDLIDPVKLNWYDLHRESRPSECGKIPAEFFSKISDFFSDFL